jgi:hypothetical protein
VPIEDIEVGDWVLSRDDSGERDWPSEGRLETPTGG